MGLAMMMKKGGSFDWKLLSTVNVTTKGNTYTLSIPKNGHYMVVIGVEKSGYGSYGLTYSINTSKSINRFIYSGSIANNNIIYGLWEVDATSGQTVSVTVPSQSDGVAGTIQLFG